MKVAIVIGHNKGTGARSGGGVDEWTWNYGIAQKMVKALRYRGVASQIFYRRAGLGYTAAMKEHARKIEAAGCTHGVELHFNAATAKAHGYEFLYWWASRASRSMAARFALEFGAAFPHRKARAGKWWAGDWVPGAKSLWLRSWNKAKADQRRGAEICYYTHCPFVICEPCFASNPSEWARMRDQQGRIARAYADALAGIEEDSRESAELDDLTQSLCSL